MGLAFAFSDIRKTSFEILENQNANKQSVRASQAVDYINLDYEIILRALTLEEGGGWYNPPRKTNEFFIKLSSLID